MAPHAIASERTGIAAQLGPGRCPALSLQIGQQEEESRGLVLVSGSHLVAGGQRCEQSAEVATNYAARISEAGSIEELRHVAGQLRPDVKARLTANDLER